MKTLPLAIVACLLVHLSLHAATVILTPEVSAILNMDFTPTDSDVPWPGRDYLLQIDVHLRIEGLLDDKHGFSNTAFNSAVHGVEVLLYVDEALGIPAWNPNNLQLDSNGPAPGGVFNKWDINSDDGAANDLRGWRCCDRGEEGEPWNNAEPASEPFSRHASRSCCTVPCTSVSR